MQPNKFFEKAHDTMVRAHKETDLFGCTVHSTRRGAGASLSLREQISRLEKKKQKLLYCMVGEYFPKWQL